MLIFLWSCDDDGDHDLTWRARGGKRGCTVERVTYLGVSSDSPPFVRSLTSAVSGSGFLPGMSKCNETGSGKHRINCRIGVWFFAVGGCISATVWRPHGSSALVWLQVINNAPRHAGMCISRIPQSGMSVTQREQRRFPLPRSFPPQRFYAYGSKTFRA